MALRVTRHQVEVLMTGMGNTRVTRQIVEVLMAFNPIGGISTALFTQSAETDMQSDTAESTVLFTDKVSTQIQANAENDFTLTQGAVSSLQTPGANSTVAFSVASRIAEEFNLGPNSIVVFTQEAISSLQTPDAANTVTFTQATSPGHEKLGAISESGAVTVTFGGEAAETLILAAGTDHVGIGTVLFTQRAVVPREADGSGTVTFSQSASPEFFQNAASDVLFTHAVGLGKVISPSPSNDVLFLQSAVGESRELSLCGYDPLSSVMPSARPPTTPVAQVTLEYPSTSPTLTLTLRAPAFGDRDGQRVTRIVRETRGGTLKVFRDPIWPRQERVQATFVALKETKGQEVLAFYEASLGKEIKLTDHLSRTWLGIILQNDDPIVRNRRDGVDVSFAFEGELQ